MCTADRRPRPAGPAAPPPLRRPGPAATGYGPAGWGARPLPWLTAVAVVFAAAQLILVVPGSGLSWDETVYVSQVGGNAPAAFFSAPRARGITYLAAPVAVLTESTTLLRVHLALLSSAALTAALLVWRKVLPVPVLVCAGASFAGLWPTLYYGPAAMPNLWCALGALAASGWVARAVPGSAGRAEHVGAGAAVALVALLRPADGFWLAMRLALAALLPGRRRPGLCTALAAGLVAGCAPWAAEAYAHYGGLSARFHRAGEIQGGLGRHFAVDDHLRALAGRTLCRPCTIGWESPVSAVWWVVLPVVTVGGILAARRAARGSAAVLAAATGVSSAVPYLFLVEYAAPRFLLPAYALLALPAGECVVGLFTRLRRARRPAGLAVLSLVLASHLAVQLGVLSHVVRTSRATSADFAALAGALGRLGVRPPCVVSGDQAVPVAYYAGCASRQTGGHDASVSPGRLREGAREVPTAVLVSGGAEPPGFVAGLRPVPLPRTGGGVGFRAYVLPAAGRSGAGPGRGPGLPWPGPSRRPAAEARGAGGPP
ncbi:hypothetical protein ABZ371_21215 [Streptomyces sp. NPDC005899]|uniref:hypothetical protein n=1 Tax=Streptomyces sp. NPDC005899 TaxID=3155716 RepID=UPI00340856F3